MSSSCDTALSWGILGMGGGPGRACTWPSGLGPDSVLHKCREDAAFPRGFTDPEPVPSSQSLSGNSLLFLT